MERYLTVFLFVFGVCCAFGSIPRQGASDDDTVLVKKVSFHKCVSDLLELFKYTAINNLYMHAIEPTHDNRVVYTISCRIMTL